MVDKINKTQFQKKNDPKRGERKVEWMTKNVIPKGEETTNGEYKMYKNRKGGDTQILGRRI